MEICGATIKAAIFHHKFSDQSNEQYHILKTKVSDSQSMLAFS